MSGPFANEQGIIHEAGPKQGQQQRCMRCGYILAEENIDPWKPGPVTVYPKPPRMFLGGAQEGAKPCHA